MLSLTQCGVTVLGLFGVSKGSFDLRRTATGDSKRSDLTDDQVLACGAHDVDGSPNWRHRSVLEILVNLIVQNPCLKCMLVHDISCSCMIHRCQHPGEK
jgi:hypothetical protein